MKRFLVPLLLAAVVAAQASAQTLTEAAQKEKERRDELKNKAAVVVTNADLSKTKKKASAAGPAAEAAAKPGSDAAAAANADARQAEIDKKFQEMKADLEDKAAKAKERAELLDLKMRSLQQRFYTFDSMRTKDQVQQEIAQTYQMLQAAGADAVKTKADLDAFLELAARDKAAAVGIK